MGLFGFILLIPILYKGLDILNIQKEGSKENINLLLNLLFL